MATEQRLPELIVKEAIGAGLDSPMRESIIEAVEDAEGPRRRVSIPLIVGAVAFGAAIGYVLGSTESTPIQPEGEPLPIETPEPVADEESENGADDETGGSRLVRLATLVAVAGAIAYLRRRRSQDEEGWEPIDEVDQPIDDATSVVDSLTDEPDEAEPSDEAASPDEDEDEERESDADESASDSDSPEPNEGESES